ncbi:DNA polymerase II large subunit [Candidatus Woesearchaeota archaeon]|nr:DNA polymerase II large subunit [Candidatus Woesearchaeota archaeon]
MSDEQENCCGPEIKQYFDEIDSKIKKAYDVANTAREQGFDPEQKVDIPLASGISERVEGLISAVAEQIIGSGVSKRIGELEQKYGHLNWRVALEIAAEVAKQKHCEFKTKKEAMEVGIRVGLAYITLGVIAAPLEGFIELRIKTRNDGKKYLSTFFAGPIRAAGGTAAAVTLIIADYVRKEMGYETYDPTDLEVKRFVAEVNDYHERVTNLQYFPSEEEIVYLAKKIPVELNGDPTEKFEVSNYKDVPRVETNRIRGGMCLVLAEGIAQKAAKLHKQLSVWGEEMGLDWAWLKDFLNLQKNVKARSTESSKKEDSTQKIMPNYTFIKDLVAGRPVLSYPLRVGGFRLRYGRARTSGFAAYAIHPATMKVSEDFLAIGTQLKIERPGKATVLSACDSIRGPVVKLINGDVVKLDDTQDIRETLKQIDKILFLGDILVSYGDFSENGHALIPAGYCEEWWALEVKQKLISKGIKVNEENISKITGLPKEASTQLLSDPIRTKISAKQAFEASIKSGVALHPAHTPFWGNISVEELMYLLQKSKVFSVKEENGEILKVVIPYDEKIKIIFEKIGLPHSVASNEFLVVRKDEAYSLVNTLQIQNDKQKIISKKNDSLNLLNEISSVEIKDTIGTPIGARMGRPEKAKMRKLQGSPHILFPVGSQGGRLRSFQAALEAKKIRGEFPTFYCESCNEETVFGVCQKCNKKTKRKHYCIDCKEVKEEPCDIKNRKGLLHRSNKFRIKEIDVNELFSYTKKKLKTNHVPELIKGVIGTSNKNHDVEHFLKGVLRAKHKIHVNKEGTTRYDMIEMPITHFKPKEIGTDIETLNRLGYKKDIKGSPLTSDDQVIELNAQDLILPDCPDSPDEYASKVLINITRFVDELLEKLYGLPAYYNVEKKKDLIGHLVIGLAPHTSAGIVGRIIGFSKTQGMYTHPMMHAAMRRNCDGDEACVVMLLDGLLNFSRRFLPDSRGSRTMDAPLVLTSRLVPSEVDDEVHGMDIAWEYPLQLYEAALEYKNPWDVNVKQIKNVLNTPQQYQGMGYTHPTKSMNKGVLCSAYKTLPSMQEKMEGQMSLAKKIVAVDESGVASLIIEKHFLKDAKGNLRKFSMQQFRCTNCNEKYRRPPLTGRCNKCSKGNIIFTISEGSIVKYLQPSIDLATKYDVSPYLQQTLAILKQQVEDVFGKETDKQIGLGEWV